MEVPTKKFLKEKLFILPNSPSSMLLHLPNLLPREPWYLGMGVMIGKVLRERETLKD